MIGAGVAGAAAALLLSRQGLRVALVDVPKPGVPCRDASEILPPAAVHALRALGADDAACLGRACRGVLSRWQHDDAAFTDYELIGCTSARAVSPGAVARCLTAHAVAAGARMITTGWLRGAYAAGCWSLASADPSSSHRIRCRHLVDGSGRSGRPVAVLPARRHHDRAVCLSSRHAASMLDPSVLLVDRSTRGWWYAVGAGDGMTDVALVTDADLLPPTTQRQAWLADAYRDARLIATALPGTPDFSRLHARDARSSERVSATASGWIAIGDAALAWDPLSGHGMRFALESASRAAAAIVADDPDDGYPSYATWWSAAVDDYRRDRASTYAAVTTRRTDDEFWRRRCPAPAGHADA